LAYKQVVDEIHRLAEEHLARQGGSTRPEPTATGPADLSADAQEDPRPAPSSEDVRWRWDNRPSGNLCPRAGLVTRLNARLEREPGVPVVLTGHGGMGKSTLAYLYADAFADKYDWIAMVAADTSETLAEDWRSLANWLGQPASDVLTAKGGLKEWLAETPRWLLVLDNAYSADVLDRLPALPMGDVLVTTREQLTGPRDFRVVTIGELEETEAEALLMEAAGPEADVAAVQEICAAHSYDPLALEKAALDLRRGVPPRRYLTRLRAHLESS
jgi:hypothetical protein